MNQLEYPKAYLYKRIVSAKLYIDRYYMRPIDLNDIATEAYFSKYHFIRLFKKAYGQTPHQYLISVRIEQSKVLLAQSTLTISDICFQVGFESLGSFSSLFKKTTGQNPRQFRTLQHQKQKSITTNPLHYIPHCFAKTKGWSTPMEANGEGR